MMKLNRDKLSNVFMHLRIVGLQKKQKFLRRLKTFTFFIHPTKNIVRCIKLYMCFYIILSYDYLFGLTKLWI